MSKVSVLVVDDAPFIRDLVKKALRGHFPGLQIEEAINGRKAQQLLGRNRYDLILCDWEMPELSGLELLQWFRAQADVEKIPFIMVTSRGDKEHVVEAIQAGVTDYIGKPFSNEQLVAKVHKALKRTGKLADLARRNPQASVGTAQETISNLMGGRRVTRPEAAPPSATASASSSASLLTAGAAPAASTEKSDPRASGVRGQAQLRLAGQQFACVVKTLSLKDALLVVRRGERLPALFESGVLDLEQDSDRSVARINGYIHALSALEPKMDCEWVRVTLKFVDQDPQKLEYLSRLIASGTTLSQYVPGA
ncbi:MAG: response regulator [Halopseudomonas yangmingensis]|uniref:Response regulator receiver domain-containing protein n=1 Tax=Halopseudomonas yangmingensis TaxID=1720063 RepID=A0A1I4QWN2_9GAMM|nr:response regulator [Halopseudomonas yangmingensis]SFM44083.1 Response regulator receiver domain-containing protein [Halopseudomonas yangmingensis]